MNNEQNIKLICQKKVHTEDRRPPTVSKPHVHKGGCGQRSQIPSIGEKIIIRCHLAWVVNPPLPPPSPKAKLCLNTKYP